MSQSKIMAVTGKLSGLNKSTEDVRQVVQQKMNVLPSNTDTQEKGGIHGQSTLSMDIGDSTLQHSMAKKFDSQTSILGDRARLPPPKSLIANIRIPNLTEAK